MFFSFHNAQRVNKNNKDSDAIKIDIFSNAIISSKFICTRKRLYCTKTDTLRAIEKLKYQQQPGLALAASKIFFG